MLVPAAVVVSEIAPLLVRTLLVWMLPAVLVTAMLLLLALIAAPLSAKVAPLAVLSASAPPFRFTVLKAEIALVAVSSAALPPAVDKVSAEVVITPAAACVMALPAPVVVSDTPFEP